MFISKQIVRDYTAEIANFSYSVKLENGLSFDLREKDLMEFIHHYIPSINTGLYLEPVIEHLKHIQSVDLLFYLRFRFDSVFQEYFSMQLFDLEFDESRTNGFCFENFDNMKEAGGFDQFFEIAERITTDLRAGNSRRSTRPFFAEQHWAFHPDNIVLDDGESMVIINSNTLTKIVQHIQDDFEVNGVETLQFLKDENRKKSQRQLVDIEFLFEHFDNDVKALKESGVSYESLCQFLHKYHLPEDQY